MAGKTTSARRLAASVLRLDDAATAAYAGFPPEWAQGIEVSCSS